MRKGISHLFDAYSVGFAIYLVLSSTSAWGLLSLASLSPLSFTGSSGVETLRSVGYIGILLFFGFGCLSLPALFKRNTTYYSTICLFLGYCGLVLWTQMPASDSAFIPGLSALLIGAGSSLSFVMWQRLFAEQSVGEAGRRIIVGSALSAVLYLLITCIACLWVYVGILLCCIVANALFLHRCRGTVFDRFSSGVIVGQDRTHTFTNIVSSTWRYMLCIAAIGYVSGVSRMLAQQGNTFTLNITLGVGMLVAAGVLGLSWEKLRKKFSFHAVYTVLFFGVMTGFLFLPFFDTGYRVLFAGVANAAFSVVSIFMMITCIKIANLRQVDPIAVFGLFSSIVYGSVLIGRAVGDVLGQSFDVAQILVVALMSTYLLSFAGIVVNSRKGSKQVADFDPVRDVNSDVEKLEVLVSGGVLNNEPDGEVAIQELAIPPLIRNVIVAQDMVPVYSRMIKKVYSLSNRETDVLELIMRGRDVARMAETLFVSENTVRSHSKNLYRKIGVHNRQQVYDLVEEFRKKEEHDVLIQSIS